MVLGPAAEFAVETPAEAEIDVPAGWQRRRVTRTRLPHHRKLTSQKRAGEVFAGALDFRRPRREPETAPQEEAS
jgi:hypothetical protein